MSKPDEPPVRPEPRISGADAAPSVIVAHYDSQEGHPAKQQCQRFWSFSQMRFNYTCHFPAIFVIVSDIGPDEFVCMVCLSHEVDEILKKAQRLWELENSPEENNASSD